MTWLLIAIIAATVMVIPIGAAHRQRAATKSRSRTVMSRSKGRIIGGLVSAVVLLAAGLLLLGLPGAVILEAADSLLGGPSGTAAFKGDKAWPAAIYVTIFMPIGVILSAVALAIMSPDAKVGPSILCGLLGYILAGVIAVTALIIIGWSDALASIRWLPQMRWSPTLRLDGRNAERGSR